MKIAHQHDRRNILVVRSDQVFVPFDRATRQIAQRYGVSPAHARAIARAAGIGAEVSR